MPRTKNVPLRSEGAAVPEQQRASAASAAAPAPAPHPNAPAPLGAGASAPSGVTIKLEKAEEEEEEEGQRRDGAAPGPTRVPASGLRAALAAPAPHHDAPPGGAGAGACGVTSGVKMEEGAEETLGQQQDRLALALAHGGGARGIPAGRGALRRARSAPLARTGAACEHPGCRCHARRLGSAAARSLFSKAWQEWVLRRGETWRKVPQVSTMAGTSVRAWHWTSGNTLRCGILRHQGGGRPGVRRGGAAARVDAPQAAQLPRPGGRRSASALLRRCHGARA